MDYLILFMEGIITFISPCILPMLPIYISFFIGDATTGNKKNAIINSIGFVIGFSIIFTLLGAAAGTFGKFINSYMNVFNIVAGLLMIIFGLNYIGIIKITLLERSFGFKDKGRFKNFNLISSILFGVVFAIGWTPCVGTFLSSALMIAANSKHSVQGIYMLLTYSLGLGIPFILSAILIDNLKSTFNFIKKNYEIINKISGSILILLGILMMTGYLNSILSFLTF